MRFRERDASDIANQHFGICGESTPLPSERDQNFLITTADHVRYVLKIAQQGEERALLECQNAVLARLQHLPGEVRVPRVIDSLSGAELVELGVSDDGLHLVRLVEYLPGQPLAEVRPHTPALLRQIGELFGAVDRELQDFSHPAALRDLYWDARNGRGVIGANLHALQDASARALIESFAPLLDVPHALDGALRRSVIHSDGNDYNLIVRATTVADPFEGVQLAGLIDFGDLVHSWTVAELAISCAYAMLGKADPIAAAEHITAGYHSVLPLHAAELEALYPLIITRLCTSAVLSAVQRQRHPENAYLSISEAPVWALLEQLRDQQPRLAHYRLRAACELEPNPAAPRIREWLGQQRAAALLPGHDLTEAVVLDFSVSSLEFGDIAHTQDPVVWSERVFGHLRDLGVNTAIGRYDEARPWYTAPAFKSSGLERDQWRTIHIGIDVFAEVGTAVASPLNGVVHSVHDNAGPLDYGPTIILRHEVDAQTQLYTLYGHLSRESLETVPVGEPVEAGRTIGYIGDHTVNGGWAPHLHFQLITDLLDRVHDFPGVARPSERAAALSLSPDPNLLLRLPQLAPAPRQSREALLAERAQRIGRSLSIAYRSPLIITRGWMQHLYDQDGQAYLDCVNNVAHIGHSHPRVVEALRRQAAVLNTNTRYLHENLTHYAERLTATLPEPLRVCFFVCSGSEANELALRLARAHTRANDVIVMDAAYHGNTSALIDLSPYKFKGAGGTGCPAHVQVVPLADPYRGHHRGADTAAQYARHVDDALDRIARRGEKVAAFFVESMPGCGGQIVLPDGYLGAAFDRVRAAGGVCVADEVQTGMGRVGSHFWAFETQGVVPDIVTVGKPIGNGHPLGAVITTPEIAASFNNGMEYFNTFGGNPVSCAVGLAVLDVIEEAGLQANAQCVGARLLRDLGALQSRHPIIGDVRGLGLYIGVELISDPAARTPAGEAASYVANRLREKGILLSTDGPDHNVLKIKPPLVFSEQDAGRLVAALSEVLSENALLVQAHGDVAPVPVVEAPYA